MLEFVVISLVLSGVIQLVLSITAFQRWPSKLALSFAVAMLCGTIWNLGFAAEIISPSLDGKLFWANIKLSGIVFLPVGWLSMTLVATGQPRKTLRRIPFWGIIPVITLLMAWINPYDLFRQNPTINSIGVPFPVLVNNYNHYVYAVHVPYCYFVIILSILLLFGSWKQLPVLYRRQRFILVLSLLIPLFVDILDILWITPIPAFNFASITFTVTGLLLSVNVLYLRFLDILPFAYETAINEMDVGVIVVDPRDQISYINPAAEKITGVANDQAIGADARRVLSSLPAIFDTIQENMEIVISQDGDENTYQVKRSSILQRKNRLVGSIITLNDITERVRLHKEVENLSFTDPLTGALNRRALTLNGEQEIQRAKRYVRNLSLILFDVDSFKAINDNFGHQCGDNVLKAIVQVIHKVVRVNDFIFRYGGDEFVVILVETDITEALEITNRIRQELAQLFVDGEEKDGPRQVSISMGVTGLASDDSLENMLYRADCALYQAKFAGKDHVASD